MNPLITPHPESASFPKHPHAQTAVRLASFNTPDREHVSRVLAVTGTPRGLYRLARQLRAAAIWERKQAEIDQRVQRMVLQAA